MTEGKTLSEAGKVFLEASEKEVGRKEDEAFNTMKQRWTETEKLKEILNESIKQLGNVIKKINESNLSYYLKQVADVGIPKWYLRSLIGKSTKGLTPNSEKECK